MKISVLIVVLVSLLSFSSSGQNPPKIQRAYAFYTESTPGMAMADEKGNTINPKPIIERFIYVECTGNKRPDVREVEYDKVGYMATVSKAMELPLNIGKSQKSNKEIILTPKKGSSLWKLELHLVSEQKNVPENIKNIAVVYVAVLPGRKLAIFHIYKETQLMVPDRY